MSAVQELEGRREANDKGCRETEIDIKAPLSVALAFSALLSAGWNLYHLRVPEVSFAWKR